MPQVSPAEKDAPPEAKGTGREGEGHTQAWDAREDEAERASPAKGGLEPLPRPALEPGIVLKNDLRPALPYMVGDQARGGPPATGQENDEPEPEIDQPSAENGAGLIVLGEP